MAGWERLWTIVNLKHGNLRFTQLYFRYGAYDLSGFWFRHWYSNNANDWTDWQEVLTDEHEAESRTQDVHEKQSLLKAVDWQTSSGGNCEKKPLKLQAGTMAWDVEDAGTGIFTTEVT